MDKCKLCGREPRRSSPANSRYWLLLAEISDKLKPEATTYSRVTWHEYFKERYLGADEVTLPNGKIRVISKSTTQLDKSEFNDYMQQVETWAAEHDVWLES